MKKNSFRRNLLPVRVANLFAENKYSEDIKSAVLFLDITGFTSATEELVKNGREGAEILSRIINTVFAPAVEIVENHGGHICVFAGDAFYALFEAKRGLKKSSTRALSAALEITDEFRGLNPVETRMGKFVFSPKTAIVKGVGELNIVKCGRRHVYYFSGKPFFEASDLTNKCPKYGVVVSHDIKKECEDKRLFYFCRFTENSYSANFRSKKGEKTVFLKNEKMPGKEYFKVQKKFTPTCILEKKEIGEFREVVVCFTSFERNDDFPKKVAFAERLAQKYGGFLNKAVVGDKGSTVMTVFGAPSAVEKPVEMAYRYAEELRSLTQNTSATGMARGTVYAGFIGSFRAGEYTVMGRCVNLSARLMQKAKKGNILMDRDSFSALKEKLNAKYMGRRRLKGIKDEIEIYQAENLNKHRENAPTVFDTLGREKEKKFLLNVFEEMLSKKINGGAVFVDGEPGTGKTQLVSEVLDHESVQRNFIVINLAYESAAGESLSPVIKFLREYIPGEGKIFEEILQGLSIGVKENSLREDLLRGKEYLFHYAGVKDFSSEFSGLKPERIIENFSYAFKAFIKGLSLIKPVVLALDDFQCADADSVELVKILSRNVENYPFVFVFTCRLKDDGEPLEAVGDFSTIKRLKLENFNKDLTRQMLEKKFMSENLPVETVEYFHAKTGGNPFFLEQFSMYFLENGFIGKNMDITVQSEEIPADINSVITARFDRLTEDFKETVRNASVLGKEFAVEVLTKMLGKKNIIKDLKSGENALIWISLEKIKYMFKHILIRDSVYQMILKEKLRKLHSFAAQIIEQVYSADLTPHYRELFYHYDIAEEAEKVIYTGEKALNYASEMGMREDSLKYAETLDRYLLGSQKTENRIRWARLLSKTSENKKALNLALETIEKAKSSDEKKHYCSLLNIIFDLYLETGTRDEIDGTFRSLKELFGTLKDPVSIIETLENIAMYYHHIGFEEEGYPWAKRALEEAENLCAFSETKENLSLLAKNYSRNAVYFGRQMGFDKVFNYLEKALSVVRKAGNRPAEGLLYGNLGLSYMEIKLDIENALLFYNKSLEIHEKYQDRHGMLVTLNNMALILMHRKEEEAAKDMLEKAYYMAVEIGDNVMQIICLINICNYKKRKGLLAEAVMDIEKAAEKAKMCGKDLLYGQILDISFGLKLLTKEFREAEKSNKILLQLSEKIKNEYLFFKFEMNSALYLSERGEKEKAILSFNEMLGKYSDGFYRAEIFYNLWKAAGDEDAKTKALSFYKKLIYEDTSEFKQLSYLEIFEELNS
ncbi:AAA family ATPase [candidate division WOR-3 bacterium]|nr:AAA family ATPase [candidate division WOR-3 bacterium]